jgi:hypothetical protein
VIACYLALTILHGDSSGGAHWTGSHQMTVKVFELFAGIFIFGGVAFTAGISLLRRGRVGLPLIGVMFCLVAMMFFVGHDIMQLGN